MCKQRSPAALNKRKVQRTRTHLANFVLDTLILQLLLILAHPGNLGVSVHDSRDSLVVDVTVAARDHLDSCDTLLLGLVCKHWAESDVTNALDTLAGGVVLVVHNDTATLVQLHTDGLKVETGGHRSATDGDEHHIGIKLCTQRGSRRADRVGTTRHANKPEPEPRLAGRKLAGEGSDVAT